MINETMYGLGNAPSAIRELFAYGLERKQKLAKTRFSISASVTPASQLLTKLQKPCMSWPICLLLSYTRIPLLLAWMKRKWRLQTILIVALAPITLPRTSTSPRALLPAFLAASSSYCRSR